MVPPGNFWLFICITHSIKNRFKIQQLYIYGQRQHDDSVLFISLNEMNYPNLHCFGEWVIEWRFFSEFPFLWSGAQIAVWRRKRNHRRRGRIFGIHTHSLITRNWCNLFMQSLIQIIDSLMLWLTKCLYSYNSWLTHTMINFYLLMQ